MQQHIPIDVHESQAPSRSSTLDPWQLQHATRTDTPLPADQDGTPVLQSSPTTAHTTFDDAYQYLSIDSNQPVEACPQSTLLHTPHFGPPVIPHPHAQAGRFIYVSKWAYGLGLPASQAFQPAQQFLPRQPAALHGLTEEPLPSQTASPLALGVNQAYQQGWPEALTPSTQVYTPPTPTFKSIAKKRSNGEVDEGQVAVLHSAPHKAAQYTGQGGPKRQKVTDGPNVAGNVGHGVEQRVDELEFQSLAEAQQHQHNFVSVLPETAAKDKVEAIQESNGKQRDWVKAIVNAIGGDYKQLPGGEHDKFPGHVQEWQRFQNSNLAKVRKAMHGKGKSGIELAAWALLRGVLKGHSRGLCQTGTWTVDKRSTVKERLQKCVNAIQELPIVALDTLKGQGIHEFAANPESFAKRKIGNLWVNYYKKLAAKGTKVPKEERSMRVKSGGGRSQQKMTEAGGQHDDGSDSEDEGGPAVDGEGQ